MSLGRLGFRGCHADAAADDDGDGDCGYRPKLRYRRVSREESDHCSGDHIIKVSRRKKVVPVMKDDKKAAQIPEQEDKMEDSESRRRQQGGDSIETFQLEFWLEK